MMFYSVFWKFIWNKRKWPRDFRLASWEKDELPPGADSILEQTFFLLTLPWFLVTACPPEVLTVSSSRFSKLPLGDKWERQLPWAPVSSLILAFVGNKPRSIHVFKAGTWNPKLYQWVACFCEFKLRQNLVPHSDNWYTCDSWQWRWNLHSTPYFQFSVANIWGLRHSHMVGETLIRFHICRMNEWVDEWMGRWIEGPQPDQRAWSIFICQKENLAQGQRKEECCANGLGVRESVRRDSGLGWWVHLGVVSASLGRVRYQVKQVRLRGGLLWRGWSHMELLAVGQALGGRLGRVCRKERVALGSMGVSVRERPDGRRGPESNQAPHRGGWH